MKERKGKGIRKGLFLLLLPSVHFDRGNERRIHFI